MWFQNQNLGDLHGCLVGKYKPFGKKISFLALKKKPEPFRARFENPFWTLLNIGRNAPKTKFRIVII